MGRYLTLSSSGLHRGKSTVQSQQLPAHRSCLLSENQDDFCMPLDTGSLHLSGPQRSHTEAGNSSLSLKVLGKNPAGPGDGETEDWRGDTCTTGQSSGCQPGGFPVHMPPCRADPGGCLRFSEPKTELSSGLRSPLCHPEQLKAKQHFISDI